MLLPREPAVLLVSLSSESCDSRADRGEPHGEAVEAILSLMVEHGLAATWASRSPIECMHTAAIAAQPRQELALWAGPRDTADQGRQAAGEEVRRQVLRFRAGGLSMSTLFAWDGMLAPDDALLVKCGIAAVCPIVVPARQSGPTGMSRAARWLLPRTADSSAAPQKRRWGLWQMPAAISLAHEGARRVRRAIDRTVAIGGMLHVHIDLASVSVAGRRSVGQVDTVLRHLAGAQDYGRLRTQTMKETAASLSRPRAVAPACSILRKKAA